tara:strand:+ start:2484 stop:3134 length:651 start_codon:yes stop_codon:yes gene_type:complete
MGLSLSIHFSYSFLLDMSGTNFDRDPAIGYVFGVSSVTSNTSYSRNSSPASIARSAGGYASSALSFLGGNPDAEFKSISGIRAQRKIEEYRPLGINNFSYKLPTTTDYSTLTLERGISKSYSDFTLWVNNFLTQDSATIPDPTGTTYFLEKKIVIVSLYDRKNPNDSWFPLMTWTFEDAIPVSVEYSGLDAQTSGIAIEKIELDYSKMTILHNTFI